jgi:hypothetical protein
MKIPIPGLNADRQLSVELDVNSDGSLESAGRRTVLLTRLLIEHKVAELLRNETKQLSIKMKHDIVDLAKSGKESFVATSYS